jgi:hypothetical protein
MVVLSELKNSAPPNEIMKNINENMENMNKEVESNMQKQEQWPTSAANPFIYYVPYTGDGTNIATTMAPLPWWSAYGIWPSPYVNPIIGNFGQQQEREKESSSTGSVTHVSEVVDEMLDAGEPEANVSVGSNKREEEKHARGFVPYKRHKWETGNAEVPLSL